MSVMSQQQRIFFLCLTASATLFVRLIWGHTDLVSKDDTVHSSGIIERTRFLMDTPIPHRGDYHLLDGSSGGGNNKMSSAEKGGGSSLRAAAASSTTGSSSLAANENDRIQSLWRKRKNYRAELLSRTKTSTTTKTTPLQLAQITDPKKNIHNNNNNNNPNEEATTTKTTSNGADHYYRQLPVKKLRVCTPRKVGSSATEKILLAWKQLPPLPPPPPKDGEESEQNSPSLLLPPANPKLEKGSYSFAIIRDPLERLYSGYHNKCLHQRENEPEQCPGFPNARQQPPSFLEFLEESNRSYAQVSSSSSSRGGGVHGGTKRRRKGPFASNLHFSPMSLQCPLLDQFDQVFHMSSPTFNHDVASLWIELGAPMELVENDFPLNNDTKPQQHSYYSNAAQTASSQYDCQHLLLALPLLVEDYQGDYSDYFPLPTWATQTLNTTNCQNQIQEWKIKTAQLENQTQQEEEFRQQRLQQLAKEKNVTSLRQLLKHKLHVCTPLKVASSATGKIFWEWKKIPLAPKSLRDPKFKVGNKDWSYSFAIIRDPLERLYSGYHNKCLHQRETESTQCPGFPNAKQQPPTFLEFLQQIHVSPTPFFQNQHFSPQSRQCPPPNFDDVFHMSSPTFNQDVAQTWIELGAPPELVSQDFPLSGNTTERQLHSYHANAAATVTSQYNCTTLVLALPALKADYQGQYKQYFPIPEWAKELFRQPECKQYRAERKARLAKQKAA